MFRILSVLVKQHMFSFRFHLRNQVISSCDHKRSCAAVYTSHLKNVIQRLELSLKEDLARNINSRWLDQVTNGPCIKAEDAESIERLSILLSSCTNTLRSIGYSSEIESPDNMRKIIDRLPPSLQVKWRKNADRILSVEGCEIRIEDISDFVEQKFDR